MFSLAAYLHTPWQTKQTDLCLPPSDPRTTSIQSLIPSLDEDPQNVKRRLLVIYIHGFVGSEDSFHSFPFHVHMQLKDKVARTHVVHSKIYPRYKTYRAFHLARDNLSQWLSAHQGPNTDIILVGHSMGGLLAEEVVLMRKKMPKCSSTRKHNILGTVHLDAPLLGAQNRVILAGVLSPFRSKAGVFAMQHTNPSSEIFDRSYNIRSSQSSQSSQSAQSPHQLPIPCSSQFDKALPKSESDADPQFNQPFANDIRIQNRGWWENVLHFTRKHENEGFILASLRHWKAHFEFGSCLLNSHRLKERYNTLRELDSAGPPVDAISLSRYDERIRFVQFYTASYKGRAGKRFIEKNYSKKSDRPEIAIDGGQNVTVAREEVDQYAEESGANDGSFKDNDNPEELHFCKLARQKDGEIDPLWKKVMVATNDEINAHVALLLPGPHYQDLVDRVSTEVISWVSELDSAGARQKYAGSRSA